MPTTQSGHRSAQVETTSNIARRIPRTRRRKACQRCRVRKQRCDGQEPTCQNCAASGHECLPAIIDATEVYSVRYVRSLERRVADLENKENQPPLTIMQRLPNGTDNSETDLLPSSTSHITHPAIDPIHWQLSFFPPVANTFASHQDATQLSLTSSDMNHSAAIPRVPPIRLETYSPSTEPFLFDPISEDGHPSSSYTSSFQPSQIFISIPDAARYFQLYFDIVHARYPFLDVEECSKAYIHFSGNGKPNDQLEAIWYSFLTTMIFAIASMIEEPDSGRLSKSQQDKLKVQVQKEQGVISNYKASPLIRLKSMLLYVLYSNYCDTTSRLVHLSGVTMRFATLHGYHRLQCAEDEETIAKIRVWSSAYALDRAISGTLRIPLCVSDSFITSPLYVSGPPTLKIMSWLSDCDGIGDTTQILDLNTFTHMCKIRQIQSKCMCIAATLKLNERTTFIKTIQSEINEWSQSEQLFTHGHPESEGYLSPLYLKYVGHVAEVLLYITFAGHKTPSLSDKLMRACCSCCNSFRAIQKKRRLARAWIDMMFNFQCGVTILYLVWCGHVIRSNHVDQAIRDCTSSLAILAHGSPNIEHFRDCFDSLATYISIDMSVQDRSSEILTELKSYSQNVIEIGVAPDVQEMLDEICNEHG